MKPLIKWPGGKSKEIENIASLIPLEYERYIEPFVGGGAVYFYLKSNNNIINDIDSDLVKFYSLIKSQNEEFLGSIDAISRDWDLLENLVEVLFNKFKETLREAKLNPELSNGLLREETGKWLEKLYQSNQIRFNIQNSETFYQFLLTSLSSKISRISKLELKHRIVFDHIKLTEHVETAIRAAYYTMLRDTSSKDDIEKNARFFFIREFCYGSMFRFNSNGKFNIPYGGINYNKKDFNIKIKKLKSLEVVKLFEFTQIFNEDFERLFEIIKPNENDFIFFDPPYDSDFKDYGKNPFDFEDQVRLANIITKLPSKIVMIINKSPKIFELYKDMQQINSNLQITDYDKKYTYNVRGRNNRDTQHLLITNFPQNVIREKKLEEFFV